ncbi:hypothetical protein [Ectothiorhodospira sp. PHS-1]|uniref:hypothetical protein n=1 Tax=Ectothiorhodospira sp. PHS-1 TaxID=519989 RepID=UPI001145939C|nr:hypothetical protein [Ectothiorhodospira sp. PHS-1]
MPVGFLAQKQCDGFGSSVGQTFPNACAGIDRGFWFLSRLCLASLDFLSFLSLILYPSYIPYPLYFVLGLKMLCAPATWRDDISVFKRSPVLFDTPTATVPEADARTRRYACTGLSGESQGVPAVPDNAEIALSLRQVLALNTRQLRARRVRVLGYGVSVTVFAYLAFCFVAGLFLPPLITAVLVVLSLGGFAMGCVGFVQTRRLAAERHTVVRKLYARGLRVKGRSVVTNTPHPTTLAVCRRS